MPREAGGAGPGLTDGAWGQNPVLRGQKKESVVVMAELLATQDGVGAALAVSRSHLDTAATMAWISAVVGLLLMVEYLVLVLEPVKRELERWREQGA